MLRIPVEQGKPGALHLHHDAVALLKNMVYLVQAYFVFFDLARCNWLRHCEVLTKASPENIRSYYQLILAHVYTSFITVWIYIDQFYYPICVRTCSCSKQVCYNIACYCYSGVQGL